MIGGEVGDKRWGADGGNRAPDPRFLLVVPTGLRDSPAHHHRGGHRRPVSPRCGSRLGALVLIPERLGVERGASGRNEANEDRQRNQGASDDLHGCFSIWTRWDDTTSPHRMEASSLPHRRGAVSQATKEKVMRVRRPSPSHAGRRGVTSDVNGTRRLSERRQVIEAARDDSCARCRIGLGGLAPYSERKAARRAGRRE